MASHAVAVGARTPIEPFFPVLRALFYRRPDLQIAFGRAYDPFATDDAHRSRARNWILPPGGTTTAKGAIGTGTRSIFDRIAEGLDACIDADASSARHVDAVLDHLDAQFDRIARALSPLMGRRSPHCAMAALQREHGECIDRYLQAVDPDSEDGPGLSDEENRELEAEARDIRRECDELILRLRQARGVVKPLPGHLEERARELARRCLSGRELRQVEPCSQEDYTVHRRFTFGCAACRIRARAAELRRRMA